MYICMIDISKMLLYCILGSHSLWFGNSKNQWQWKCTNEEERSKGLPTGICFVYPVRDIFTNISQIVRGTHILDTKKKKQ